MILFWLILILIAGGTLAWFAGKINNSLPRWISLIALLIDFILIIIFWIDNSGKVVLSSSPVWIEQLNWKWIPQFGISFHLAIDGLSLILLTITFFLGILSVLTSWTEIKQRVGFFHFNMLWLLAGISGVFLSLDLFLFYFFWELMLVPMYFLIGIWGHENRIYAAYKFFLFTQASGLLMFLAILGLYFIHGSSTGIYTFDYTQLLGTHLTSTAGMFLMLGFLIAFLVKLPAVPFHNWLPDAHTQAPTAGSVILAGLLLKTGAYGMLRFILPLFPEASIKIAPIAMFAGMIGILYGAKLAFAQTDFKRLVAYSSVSHMGFILLGIFAMNELALQGVVMQMVAHAISTGALFIIVGLLQERIHTRDFDQMGGLWEQVPRMGGVTLVFVMGSLGLPGLGNFIAEFLTLAGTFQASIWITVLASLGLISSVIYSLKIMQKVFYTNKKKKWELPDFNFREMLVMTSLILAIVWTGLFPQTIFNTTSNSMKKSLEKVTEKNKIQLKISEENNYKQEMKKLKLEKISYKEKKQ